MASFASSATTCGARKHAWTNYSDYPSEDKNVQPNKSDAKYPGILNKEGRSAVSGEGGGERRGEGLKQLKQPVEVTLTNEDSHIFRDLVHKKVHDDKHGPIEIATGEILDTFKDKDPTDKKDGKILTNLKLISEDNENPKLLSEITNIKIIPKNTSKPIQDDSVKLSGSKYSRNKKVYDDKQDTIEITTGDILDKDPTDLGETSELKTRQKLGNHPNRGGGGLAFYPVFPTSRLGNGFYEEKGGSGPSPTIPTGDLGGLERLGWFPNFYLVLSSEVSPMYTLKH